jgi:putative transcriptional regulator
MSEIYSKLPVLMAQKKINQTDLAKALGISRPTIARLYNGTFDALEIKTITKLCDYFQCDVGDLLTIKEDHK